MIRRLVPLLLAVCLAACGATKDNYSGAYVGGDASTLLQLHIVESGDGQITGNLVISTLDYRARKLKHLARRITGVRNGDQFSLLAHKRGWMESDAQLQFEAKGRALDLMVPGSGVIIEMLPMEQDEYRERLAKFASPLKAS